MLRSVKELEGYKIIAKDGEIGKVYDFFFDDYNWVIRYLVVDTGGWLPGRRVLISPYSLGTPDWNSKNLPVSLTRSQVENSPEIDEHKPMERQKEIELRQYFGWPDYWISGGDPMAGTFAVAGAMPSVYNESVDNVKDNDSPDYHLHSTKSIIDYSIAGNDDSIGHVEDFIIDDDGWQVRYFIVDTRNWLPGGKKVILSPHWIKRMSWSESVVYVDLTKEQIKNCPEWDPSAPPQRDYEEKLYNHYGKQIYW